MSKKFKRRMWWMKKLGTSWRRPKGRQNKLRKKIKSKGRLPSPGYGSPRSERGLHPSGLEEVRVFNAAALQEIDPETQAARIGGSVGTRKRMEIAKAAEEEGIKVLNLGKRAKEALNGDKKVEDADGDEA